MDVKAWGGGAQGRVWRGRTLEKLPPFSSSVFTITRATVLSGALLMRSRPSACSAASAASTCWTSSGSTRTASSYRRSMYVLLVGSSPSSPSMRIASLARCDGTCTMGNDWPPFSNGGGAADGLAALMLSQRSCTARRCVDRSSSLSCANAVSYFACDFATSGICDQ